ncbi:MAG: CsgG/HfaB family protein [Candidatus Latescibacteria bacterium]|nr:CsgG/HfaB family protein [Candidatus Latescibacterota bacterium]
MNRRTLGRLAVVTALLGLLAAGTAVAGAKDRLTEQNNKCRIVVGQIKSNADQCDWGMAAAIGQMLSTALANEDRFIVLASQEEVAELAGEIELSESGLVEEGRGAERGLMEGADVMVTGAVTSFEPEASGGGGLLGAAKSRLGGSVGVSSNTAECTLDLKLIDIRTRRVIKAFSVEGKSKSWSTDLTGAGWVEDVALGGALGSYSNQPMEKALRTVLAKAVERVAKDVPQEYYRYTGDGQYTQEYAAGGGGSGAAPAAGGAGGDDDAPLRTAASGGGASGGRPAGKVAEDMALYTRCDFVPGDRTIFCDDLDREEVGEFPSRWNLVDGVFEVARKGDKGWILCSDTGNLSPKLPAGPFPEKYTIEMDIYDNGEPHSGHWYTIKLMEGETEAIVFFFGDSQNTRVTVGGETKSDKALTQRVGKGRHTLRIMATSTTFKCYLDNERVGNVPKVEGVAPDGIRVSMDRWDQEGNPMLMSGFRFAAGGKTLRDQLAQDGRIVTHGILFDSGSAVIKAESYKTLADLGELLKTDAGLRLSIEGHTDSEGADDANLALSQQRAASVKDYLGSAFGVAADRLEVKGLGETRPLGTNDTSEGRANNRRVELVKI